jgi:hypothetical protein
MSILVWEKCNRTLALVLYVRLEVRFDSLVSQARYNPAAY